MHNLFIPYPFNLTNKLLFSSLYSPSLSLSLLLSLSFIFLALYLHDHFSHTTCNPPLTPSSLFSFLFSLFSFLFSLFSFLLSPQPNYFLKEGNCVASCGSNSGFFASVGDIPSCISCGEHCQACNSAQSCTTCNTYYTANVDGTCELVQCTTGEFLHRKGGTLNLRIRH